jgi:poly-gamma-glutamate capsule biosynthesis protein CapA/YwtB (metallophosphatase superfamily)
VRLPAVTVRRRSRVAAVAGVAAGLLALTACGSGSGAGNAAGALSGASSRSAASGTASPGSSSSAHSTEGSASTGTPTTSGTGARRSGGGPVTLAFAGDIHFEGTAGSSLHGGRVGSAFGLLRDADLAVVNLETAITDRGTAQPKEFTFRAPAAAIGILGRAGVDAVSIANNHGMDYGRVGLADTLAAAKRYGMPVLGAGTDDTAAWTPLRRTIDGVRISVIAATDVLDDFATSAWVARPGASGLASAKDTDRLLDAVRSERAKADVVVAFLHWGKETVYCPTARQQQLAQALAEAGADVVVGSHAHVVEPTARIGHTVVDYGMGNFQFYADGGLGAESGVLTVTVTRAGAGTYAWHPATIVSGAPMILSGSSAAAQQAAEQSRFSRC